MRWMRLAGVFEVGEPRLSLYLLRLGFVTDRSKAVTSHRIRFAASQPRSGQLASLKGGMLFPCGGGAFLASVCAEIVLSHL